MPAVSPVIEPADPELRAHKRAALCVLFKHLKTLFCLGTEVSGRQHAGKPSAGKRLIHWTVGGYQRYLGAIIQHKLFHGFHIPGIIAIVAVFIFHLHQDNRAAVVNLQGNEYGKQYPIVFTDGFEKWFITAAKPHAVFLQKPGRKTAELPFRADIRGRTDNDI